VRGDAITLADLVLVSALVYLDSAPSRTRLARHAILIWHHGLPASASVPAYASASPINMKLRSDSFAPRPLAEITSDLPVYGLVEWLVVPSGLG